MSRHHAWEDPCTLAKPSQCFNCPYSDCISTTVATTRAESDYLRCGISKSEARGKNKKRLPLLPVRRFQVS